MAKCEHGKYPSVNCEPCNEAYNKLKAQLKQMESDRARAQLAAEEERKAAKERELKACALSYDKNRIDWDECAQTSLEEILSSIEAKYDESYDEDCKVVYAFAYTALLKAFYPND